MLFPTIRFALFFAVVLPTSWLLMPRPTRWKAFMVAASFFFYAAWNTGYVGLLAGSILANQLFAVRIDRAATERRRSAWTALAVAANLGALAWYKYVGFFADSTSTVLGWFGVDWHVSAPNVLLPVGISFFTFQALSYVIDVRRRLVAPTGLLEFATYLSFFPHLVAGPIVRARELLPQLRHRRDPRSVNLGLACGLIASGLIKKVVIASYLAGAADALFAVPARHGGVEALIGVYAYAMQIYADFSGYTDMAIGIALLLGFHFPANFDAPYTATSIGDFWRRWHMTLSRWLRDYLYIPLGGSQRGRRRTYLNLLLTMLLGGLWHGAAWTFVVWGALNGAGLAAERWSRDRRRQDDEVVRHVIAVVAGRDDEPLGSEAAEPEPPAEPSPGTVVVADHYEIVGAAPARSASMWVRRFLTFNFVCLGWVFFRATSMRNAWAVLGRILFHGSTTAIDPWIVVLIVGMFGAQLVPPRLVHRLESAWARWSLAGQSLSVALVLLFVDVVGPTGVAPFIYFQF